MSRRLFRTAALFLVGSVVFAVCYCQAPLYYSNQNQYFLHGLAEAGYGTLREDWLAKTLDPTPVFSALVAGTVRVLHPVVFHLEYALLMGVYAAAACGLFVYVAGSINGPGSQRLAEPGNRVARRWPVFAALFLLVHSALLRWSSYRLLGQDYPWFLQAGVAGQYVLGPVLQPSAFGVLLVAAVCLFARGRPYLAGLCVAVAATVHSTYLLPGALLTVAFLCALVREGRTRQALAVGAGTLVLVLPITVYTFAAFHPTSPAAFHEAQRILIQVRIPHHTQPALWCDAVAIGQLAWLCLGIIAAPAGRLRVVLIVASILAVFLTLTQVATENETLALLFPWRVSAVLVPVATAVILTRLATVPRSVLDGRWAQALSVAVVLALMVGGGWISLDRRGFYTSDDEQGLLDWARKNRQEGDLFLLPVTIPDLVRTTHGSLSSDFKPAPEKRQDSRVIPYDLQGWRLSTGTPIWVDFKVIPYQDYEVLDWYKRLLEAQQLQRELKEGNVGHAVTTMQRLGITYVVVPASLEPLGERLKLVYQDDVYRVYHVPPRTPVTQIDR